MEKVFEGRRVALERHPNSRRTGHADADTDVGPPLQHAQDLKGRVRHVAPASHRIAVYIRVDGG
jgi:hypothetical protein